MFATPLELHEMLEDAWGASTMSCNAFEKVVRSVEWDCEYEADGELYFELDGYQLACESLDPFRERWSPSALYGGSVMIFGE